MKRILPTILTVVFIAVFAFGQDNPLKTGSGSEMPDFAKESLSIKNRVELYPNPAREYLTVVIENFDLKEVKFELYNIIGNNLKVDVDEISRGKYKVNVGSFNPGYYLLVIRDPVTRYNKAYKFQKK